MRKRMGVLISIQLLLVMVLGSCGSYSEIGTTSKCTSGPGGAQCTFRARKANGSITKDLDLSDVASGVTLDVDVVLTVDAGNYKIELLGQDGEVTLDLEANNGETVSGRGEIAVNSFGEASYRVSAVEAQGVEYTLSVVP